jgi:uncharacterized protein YkwD
MTLARLEIRLVLVAALVCGMLAVALATGPAAPAAQASPRANATAAQEASYRSMVRPPHSASAAGACPSANATAGQASHRSMVRSTLCLLNAQRSRRGLRKLRLSKRLSRAAKLHARDMVRRNFFSHSSLNGSSFLDRIRRTGYLRGAGSWMVGENLAWGAGRRSSPALTVRAWMHSPGHRRNILTPTFRHIGIGIVYGAPARVGRAQAATYATEFGFKR